MHTEEKEAAIGRFRNHVSSGKADFFINLGMDLVMGDREGAFLADMDGRKKLFNLHCNGGVFNLGHRNPELIELLKQSLDEFDIGNHHLMSRVRGELAEKIAGCMPADLNYTVFGVSGGEAIDLAIKVARAWQGRGKVVSAKGGYHGHTGLALAAGDPRYRDPFGVTSTGFEQVPFGDLDCMEAAVGPDTAAVILETVPATMGVVVPGREYMSGVRELCTRKGALLILDEVQTGLGRTGRLWGFEHFDVVPDIVVLGKGLSGGLYPITATVLRQPLERIFHKDPFVHISTFGGAEPGCCVAGRVLEISSDPAFLDRVVELAGEFRRCVAVLQQKYADFLIGFRQLGLMMGLVFAGEISGQVVSKTAYDNDLLMVYANNDPSVCQLLPPLIMERERVPWVAERLEKAVSQARDFVLDNR
ncbi:MAG: aminotransferase class III-fold pyridoxal phosphate-dependent enzyme [Deltaproteobacteria bacterium]|nr:aminotransferase class III-fold pyridoxal phosphate-dependent enzyme [Deltaproteobacteria bacterium]